MAGGALTTTPFVEWRVAKVRRCLYLQTTGPRTTDITAVRICAPVDLFVSGELSPDLLDLNLRALDNETLEARAAVDIPVIACGGVGRYADFASAIKDGGASAAAAANIFHFFELSYPLAKEEAIRSGIELRPNRLGSRWIRREPVYCHEDESNRIESRLRESEKPLLSDSCDPQSIPEVSWCRRCTYPSLSAVPIEFDEHGVCMGCRMAEMRGSISPDIWASRRQELCKIIERGRQSSNSKYDCVIPVSGGKDSYFQVHVIKHELGFNPLLVTYHGNNYTPTGWRNLARMKQVFDVDHIVVRPPLETLIKLNRLGFIVMGDMNWHAHMGITTLPVRVAAEYQIPILIWGEHGYTDLSGQFSMNDFPEMSYRDRLEHFGRGYEWNYFVGREGLTSEDMTYWKYPDDTSLMEIGIRGLYLGNYVHWDANEHAQAMIDLYGFDAPETSFDRTYRRVSNLDDMHENGANIAMFQWSDLATVPHLEQNTTRAHRFCLEHLP